MYWASLMPVFLATHSAMRRITEKGRTFWSICPKNRTGRAEWSLSQKIIMCARRADRMCLCRPRSLEPSRLGSKSRFSHLSRPSLPPALGPALRTSMTESMCGNWAFSRASLSVRTEYPPSVFHTRIARDSEKYGVPNMLTLKRCLGRAIM